MEKCLSNIANKNDDILPNYSVLMSVYYKEKPLFLKKSIESILCQTILTNDFVIVCDGPLTDELNNVINYYCKKYPSLFNIVRYEINKGLGYALSYGILKTKNDIVMRMDSDDISFSNRAEIQLPLMKNFDLVGSWISEFDTIETNIFALRKTPENYDEIYRYAKKRTPFNHPSVMFKKNVVLKSGNYQTLLFVEDYFLWIRILLFTKKVYNCQEVLVNMRSGNEMRARRGGKIYRKSLNFLRKFMFKHKMINFFEYMFILFEQNVFLILPIKIKEHMYKKMLRN